jgi:GNAT superfamily N-acetyltransferase
MYLRPATLYDVPALLQLVRKVVPLMHAAGNLQWDDHYPNADVFIHDIEEGQLWVAEIDETNSSVDASADADSDESIAASIAGVAAITIDQYPEYADVGLDITEHAIVVHRLAVDPDFRGMGVASALMEHAEAVATRFGINVLRVDTNMQNAAAHKLFPKLGYRLAGEISLSFRPGMRFFCYEKRLAQT